MSSSKQKRVHYERGTKGGKSSHSHRDSRDSGVGSSSASDRASLGTSPQDELPFNYQQIQDQRHILGAVQEALDAANDKIKQLEAAAAKLSAALAESNKENRLLKKERIGLMNKVDDLIEDLEDERKWRDKYRREAPAGAPSASSSKAERRTTPPRRDPADARSYRRDDERSQGSHGERRSSWRDMPTAPQPPPNQNPFSPLAPLSPVSYAPAGGVTYATAPITYAQSPVFASPPPSVTSDRFPNDGRYHPYPL